MAPHFYLHFFDSRVFVQAYKFLFEFGLHFVPHIDEALLDNLEFGLALDD